MSIPMSPQPEAVAEARRQGVPVNGLNRPAFGNVAIPAMVRRMKPTAAIASEGFAPVLARGPCTRIEAALPATLGRLAAFCARWRERVALALPDRGRRPRRDEAAAGREATTPAKRGGGRAAGAGLAPCRGRASLVGAGPGDPDLLTVKALRVLGSADVVLYDKLVDPRVLDLARRDARRIDVGKRCGRHAMSQAAINALLVREVRAGAHVVRLKGGDPFVFGRGGEELEALRAAGAEVEVVPGITAALAAAARLGMPLTHRGVARGLHLITAHGADGELPAQNWRALAEAGGTIAVYMGARTLPRLAAALIEAGMAPGTPAIAVENVSLPGERRFPARLVDLAGTLAAAGVEGPTLVVVGAVASLADAATAPRPAMVRQVA